LIRHISLALFNDELDANLEEAINAEINSQAIKHKGKTQVRPQRNKNQI